jgi:hypothetical protein
MKAIILPEPPSARDPNFNQRAADWMAQVKSAIEAASRIDAAPLAQQFQVGTFTTNTTINSGSTLADVANYVASVITAMQARGFVSSTISRTS